MKAGIIYVSSNREDPKFERKTRTDLLEKAGELSIVAVTQKPIKLRDMDKNIVVGDVGASGFNFCRQVLMACENSKADVVISAESDCLYSPDYFDFRPEDMNIPYRNTNTYVQHYRNYHFFKKTGGTWSQVVGRKFYISRLRSLLKGQPRWNTEMKNFPKEIKKSLFKDFAYFTTKYPCLSFKTGKGMRYYTKSDRIPRTTLPYWGDTKKLIKEYLE